MKIAVDVVPIRSDGTIGGAMNFLLELLKGFGLNKENSYILLTAYWNHDFFLKYEQQYGMNCICVVEKNHLVNNNIISGIIKKYNYIKSKLEKRIIKRHVFYGVLHKNNVDLLFCPMSATTYSEIGIPTVSIIYDLQHEYYNNFFSTQELNHRRNYYTDICNKADSVICISNYTKETFLSKYTYNPNRIFVIYIGIQNRLDKPDDKKISEIMSKYNIEYGSYAYYPANFWPHKNHKMLLMAFSKYLIDNINSKLHLVLTGCSLDKEPIIKEAVKQMNLEKRVHFLGYVSDNDLACILYGCKFVIFPSLFEGFGIPVLDGLSAAKPVLCSNTTSLPEVGGDAVIYFDPKKPDSIIKAIDKVTNDIELVNEVLNKSKDQMQKFTTEGMVNSYLNVFSSVVKFKESKLTYKIEGIFEDRWSEENIKIFLTKSDIKRTLKIKGSLPKFVPNNVKITINTSSRNEKVCLAKSECKDISIDVRGIDYININIHPCFCPREININDSRNLGIIINDILLIDESSQNEIKLF